MTPKVEQRLLRSREASQYMNINAKVLHRMVLKGEIKAIRRGGLRTAWLFDIRELDRWIEKHSTTYFTRH